MCLTRCLLELGYVESQPRYSCVAPRFNCHAARNSKACQLSDSFTPHDSTILELDLSILSSVTTYNEVVSIYLIRVHSAPIILQSNDAGLRIVSVRRWDLNVDFRCSSVPAV